VSQLHLDLFPTVDFRPTGGLVDKAITKLARGPIDTATIAAEVLALRGNPRAAAAAVYALLGSDPRLRVDEAGWWSLIDAPAGRALTPLRWQNWTVVDVETTGGSPGRGSRIIEIAAVQVASGAIQGSFSTLVNPGCVSRVSSPP
jgi:hypothetical protein